MENEFIPYIEALELKKLGFNEPCFGFYDDIDDDHPVSFIRIESLCDKLKSSITLVPLYQQAFRWFREKYGWISNVWTICISTDGITSFEYAIDTLNDLGVSQYRENFPYKTYEEAELECLKALIEIVKNK
jgi:hypothetical protein